MSVSSQKILTYLHTLPQRANARVISGQYVGSALKRDYPTHIENVHATTGHWIAAMGSDFGWIDADHNTDWPEALPILTDYWDAGGLVKMCWHMPNPEPEGGAVDFVELITPGTTVNENWMVEVRRVAGHLRDLRDAGVVVIWRPFMEMNMRSGWWKGQPPLEFIGAWRYMYELYTDDYGLDNLLWLYGPGSTTGGQDVLDYYPGADYVDITGLSWYIGNHSLAEIWDRGYPELTTLPHPFTLSEFGPGTGSQAPDPFTYDYDNLIRDIRVYCPRVVMFQAWNKSRSLSQQNNVAALLGDSWIVNRDGLDWDVEPPPPVVTPLPDWAALAELRREEAVCKRLEADIADAEAVEYEKLIEPQG